MTRRSPTAFVDLRQLGFHGRAGGPIDHALQAAATGALWRVFRARGNQLLLLNGTTTDRAQVTLYSDHLDATPMTTIRLTAAPSELTARALARRRGEMAPLAGDDLVRAHEGYLQQLVDGSIRAQQSWPPADDPVLDTTTLSAADAARLVFDHTRTHSWTAAPHSPSPSSSPDEALRQPKHWQRALSGPGHPTCGSIASPAKSQNGRVQELVHGVLPRR